MLCSECCWVNNCHQGYLPFSALQPQKHNQQVLVRYLKILSNTFPEDVLGFQCVFVISGRREKRRMKLMMYLSCILAYVLYNANLATNDTFVMLIRISFSFWSPSLWKCCCIVKCPLNIYIIPDLTWWFWALCPIPRLVTVVAVTLGQAAMVFFCQTMIE